MLPFPGRVPTLVQAAAVCEAEGDSVVSFLSATLIFTVRLLLLLLLLFLPLLLLLLPLLILRQVEETLQHRRLPQMKTGFWEHLFFYRWVDLPSFSHLIRFSLPVSLPPAHGR